MFVRIPAHSLRRAAGILLVAIVLSACSAVQPVATPQTLASTVAEASATPAASEAPAASSAASEAPVASASDAAATDNDSIQASIQETLDLYAQAYNDNDRSLLAQTVDTANGAFARLITGRFDSYQASMFGGSGGYAYNVKDITHREHGFVEAQIELYGSIAVWTFREVDGRWLLSEPTEKQIGKRQKTEREHFIYYTYPWRDDINAKVMDLMEQAHNTVQERMGKTPEQKAEVYIKPIFSIPPLTDSQTLAFYWPPTSSRGSDKMIIFAPNTFSFGFYDPSIGWEEELQQTLTHEYVHLVNNRSFTPIARMSDWMFEGIAEYVSDSPRANEVIAAVRSDQIIPIIDTSDRVYKQDLQRLTILEENQSLAYGLSYSLVAFIVEKHGGMDGFWKLVNSYDKKQNLPAALQEAFGVSYEQFDQDWRAWLKENY